MDIRTERTRKMLFDAFEELLEIKPMEEISVVEICERSTIRRATFYRHFEEKYDFYNHYLQSLTERFMAELELASESDDLLTYARKMQWALIMFLEGHPNIAKQSVAGGNPSSNIDLMVKQVADGIIRFADKDCKRANQELPIPTDFLGMFYSGGMVQTLRWWIQEGKPISTEKLIDYSTSYLEHYFEAFVKQ